MKINKSVQTGNKAKNVKVNTAKASAKAKAQAKQTAKQNKVKAVSKTASRFKLDGDLLEVERGYKAFKTLANKDYQLFGEGFANIRGCSMGVTSKRAVGQHVWITKDSKGYGFLIGAKVDANTMQCGNIRVQLDSKKIVKAFNDYKSAVAYVFKTGESNVKGITQGEKALDAGADYLIVSNGKRLTKVNHGSGTGRHAQFTNSAKAFKASNL